LYETRNYALWKKTGDVLDVTTGGMYSNHLSLSGYLPDYVTVHFGRWSFRSDRSIITFPRNISFMSCLFNDAISNEDHTRETQNFG
jgi:hypothetical protein